MYVDTPETAFLHDLTKPSLEALSYILRHREHWPDGFEWHFGNCSTCAMGLANELWQEAVPYMHYQPLARALGMTPDAAESIFNGTGKWAPGTDKGGWFIDFAAITPEMVADQLDLYIAGRR